MRKAIAILLVVLFVVTVTAGAVSAGCGGDDMRLKAIGSSPTGIAVLKIQPSSIHENIAASKTANGGITTMVKRIVI